MDRIELGTVGEGDVVDIQLAGLEFVATGWHAVDVGSLRRAEGEVDGGVGSRVGLVAGFDGEFQPGKGGHRLEGAQDLAVVTESRIGCLWLTWLDSSPPWPAGKLCEAWVRFKFAANSGVDRQAVWRHAGRSMNLESNEREPRPGGEAGGASGSETLEELRSEIDAIDQRVVELLAQRLRRVQQVVAIKKAQRLPVYHPAREENLISQRREQAVQAGLDPDHIEELYRSILRQSRVRQTIQVARTGVRPGAKVLLIGGRGKMGTYFGRWFAQSGYEVEVLDVDDWPRVTELVAGVELALVCVPIDRTVEVIEQLGPHLPSGCVLADITSVKQAPVEAMLAAHSGPVIGLHPLFGPTTTTMDQQVVAATPGRMADDCQWLMDQFVSWGNVVLPLEAREHDDIMAVVQGLRHFATFAFGDFLYRQNVNVTRTLDLSSPIYRLELGMIGRLFAQDPTLYAEILFASPGRRALLQQFVDSFGQYGAMLAEGDKAAFCAEFRRIAEWFGPFCGQAMRESNFLIDKLVERF